ncbi:hypothetical protein HMPREF3190_01030 [Umbribacter vaginalis]|nr:hypothetical protein HMPREF3190_01030 [Coriobacteriales bacterium DNF00809]
MYGAGRSVGAQACVYGTGGSVGAQAAVWVRCVLRVHAVVAG